MELFQGDCLEVLTTLKENSIDALITDPPAGIGFMGKEWDHHKGGRKEWCAWMESVMRECLRVMKPGAHGLVWALPRTSHWTATALEDAGFEIRDCVYHLFGSGFPKSLDVSKAIDKAAGAEREVIGKRMGASNTKGYQDDSESQSGGSYNQTGKYIADTIAATDAAKQWQGFGTALKPAVECWWLVRKPISEKTVAANVLKWGTGALNIDGSRVATEDNLNGGAYTKEKGRANSTYGKLDYDAGEYRQPQGRFPSHLLLSHTLFCVDGQCADDCAVAMLDAQSGHLVGAGNKIGSPRKQGTHFGEERTQVNMKYDNGGGASRFFYCAKVSSSERNAGGPNGHPTVKSLKLMRYLARLVTPPGGALIDPFMGSGSTGLAAKSEGFGFVGIEREAEYFEIAKARIETCLI